LKLVSIDLGTTSVKVEIYNGGGSFLIAGRASIREQTVDAWVNALLEAFPSKALKESKPEEKIVVVDSTSGSFLLVDKMGNPLFPPSMYYEKAAKEFEELNRFESARVLADKGNALSPTSPLPRILRLKRQDPERFKRVRWILPPATWLTYKLYFKEGEKWENLSIDWTNALKFGEDITKSRPEWFKPVFDDAGVPLKLLPSIVPCGAFVGYANSNLAKDLGLDGARIYHGMTDGNASALATGCVGIGDFGLGCGTTTVPKYVCSELKPHEAIYYHKHPIQGYLAGAAPVTGGMIDWFIGKVLGINAEEAYSLAEKAKPGEEYLYFPQGDRSPFNDASMGAAFLDLWPSDEPRDVVVGKLVRSMLLGVTFLEYYYIALFEELFETKIKRVNITGGGTRSFFWNLIRASVYERPVRVMEEKVCVGALIPIVVNLGFYKNAEEASKVFLKVVDEVKPSPKLVSKYRDRRDSFMAKWEKLREVYRLG
jgi:xylulokinase